MNKSGSVLYLLFSYMIITNAIMTLMYVFVATCCGWQIIDIIVEKFPSIAKTVVYAWLRTIFTWIFEAQLVGLMLLGCGWLLYTLFVYVKVFL